MIDNVKWAQELRNSAAIQANPAWRDQLRLIAEAKFAQFSAYRTAGFDAKQALELVIRDRAV